MNTIITPSLAKGQITAPPSKSFAHRMLIAAALSEGRTTIHNLPKCEDVAATMDCLKALGAGIEVSGENAFIIGVCKENFSNSEIFRVKESGSTLRFLIPLLATDSKARRIIREGSLIERSIEVYEELFAKKDALIKNCKENILVRGPISAGKYYIPGNVSSQFVSGLLMALPLMDGESELFLTCGVESSSYIDMTIRVLSDFGVKIIRESKDHMIIPGGQIYSAHSATVEGDHSSCAYMQALNLLGGEVVCNGLSDDSLQPDAICTELFAKLKSGGSEINISDCPDLGPILFAIAAALKGAVFTGIHRLRLKESDRISAMASELRKFGVDITVSDNSVYVPKSNLVRPCEVLYSHNDHRIAMALAILATVVGGEIADSEVVAKSYPEFWNDLRALGIKIDFTHRN